MRLNLFILILTLGLTSTSLKGTTWFPVKHKCPICKAKHTYQEIGSYGSYIYNWPSKYQYVYWPLTDNPSIYCCLNCCFSSYLWDFDSIPANKTATIKQALSKIKLSKKYDDYLNIPITERLEIAEQVYRLRDKDNEFWCKFYRVMAYHYDYGSSKEVEHFSNTKEKGRDCDSLKSQNARNKAIVYAYKILKDSTNKEYKKETFYILGAMYYHIKQKDSAIYYLDKVPKTEYNNKNWEKKDIDGFNQYLNNLTTSYKEMILNRKEYRSKVNTEE